MDVLFKVIPINEIVGPVHPIRHDVAKIKELANSLKSKGMMHPIHVSEVNGKYELVSGLRRLMAATEAGFKEVPVIIEDKISEQDAYIKGIVENLQREDLSPIDEAQAYEELQKRELSDKVIAGIVGKARNTVTEIRGIADLPEDILKECRTADFSQEILVTLTRISRVEGEGKMRCILARLLLAKEEGKKITIDQIRSLRQKTSKMKPIVYKLKENSVYLRVCISRNEFVEERRIELEKALKYIENQELHHSL